jgi:hypothetical protein
MAFSTSTPIRGLSFGSPETIATWAIAKGAARPDDVRSYLQTMHRLCTSHGMSFHVAVAQSVHETSDQRIPWNSFWWRGRCNPAGIGITGDARQNAVSRDFQTGEAAARAQFVHLWLYAVGTDVPTGLTETDDPRWDAAVRAGYAGIATTIGDLTNRWAADPKYGEKIARTLNELDAAGLLEAVGEPEIPVMDTKMREDPLVLAIGMGHRNTGRGGARDEIHWTPKASRMLQRRAKARGMIAELIQEHDGDKEPDWSNTDRQTAAKRGVAAIEKRHGNVDVVIFMHYNGGGAPGAHFIHPDGWTAPYRKVDNPGDVRLCRRIKNHVKATGTVGLLSFQTWMDEVGVMSEKETGAVAHRKGYRLGEILGVEDWREDTFRVIAEAGSIDVPREAAYIRDDRWVEFTYCEAILDALEEEFGVYRPGDGTGGGQQPKPPINPTPNPGFDTPIRIPELDAFKGRPDETIPSAVKTASEGWFYFIGRDVTVTKATPRMRKPDASSKDRTGVDVPEGEVFYAWWGGVSKSGRPYAYTLWGSRIWLEDTDFGLQSDGAVAA